MRQTQRHPDTRHGNPDGDRRLPRALSPHVAHPAARDLRPPRVWEALARADGETLLLGSGEAGGGCRLAQPPPLCWPAPPAAELVWRLRGLVHEHGLDRQSGGELFEDPVRAHWVAVWAVVPLPTRPLPPAWALGPPGTAVVRSEAPVVAASGAIAVPLGAYTRVWYVLVGTVVVLPLLHAGDTLPAVAAAALPAAALRPLAPLLRHGFVV